MALGLERLLGDRLWGGSIAVKEGYTEPLSRLTLLPAGHPVPDARSLRAARAVLDLAAAAGPDDLVIVLLSGGGSALLAAPLLAPGHTLTLADKQAVTRALLASGADIHDVNRVRKKLSAIKGGRLARAIAPAHCLSLVLSDVVGDDLASIASGPTVPDGTLPATALAILDRYGLSGRIPAAAEALLRDVAQGRAPDTLKPGDPAFDTCRTVLVGTNFQALLAARDKARALGYSTLVLTSRLTGEAREVARLFSALARDMARHVENAVGRFGVEFRVVQVRQGVPLVQAADQAHGATELVKPSGWHWISPKGEMHCLGKADEPEGAAARLAGLLQGGRRPRRRDKAPVGEGLDSGAAATDSDAAGETPEGAGQ